MGCSSSRSQAKPAERLWSPTHGPYAWSAAPYGEKSPETEAEPLAGSFLFWKAADITRNKAYAQNYAKKNMGIQNHRIPNRHSGLPFHTTIPKRRTVWMDSSTLFLRYYTTLRYSCTQTVICGSQGIPGCRARMLCL